MHLSSRRVAASIFPAAVAAAIMSASFIVPTGAAAILRTCEVQMRPVAMTCIVACVGLLPAALSSGIGSQVQKPLAIVVVGGSLLAPLLIFLVLPVLMDLFSRRRSWERAAMAEEMPPPKRRSAEMGDI